MFEQLFKYPLEKFHEGSVIFTGSFGIELRILAIVLLGLAVFRLYRRIPPRISVGRRHLLAVVRITALILMLLLIFPPVLRMTESRMSDRFVVFLLDQSRSMSVKDTPDGKERIEQAKQMLFGNATNNESALTARIDEGLLRKLSAVCGVRLFGFARNIERISDISRIEADGDITDMYGALTGIHDQFRGMPLAALVVVSDGNHNAEGDPLDAARLMRVRQTPIYTIGVGTADPPPDRQVVSVAAPRKVRRHSNIQVMVSVQSQIYTDPYPVRLLSDDKVIQEKTVRPNSKADYRTVTFPIFLEKHGTYRYVVEIPPAADEKIVVNNRKEFTIQVREDRLPVLYVEGSPRPEYRFIRKALRRDEDFRIVSVLRIGEKGLQGDKDRFLIQGAEKNEETSLLKGYPGTKEELFAFEAVIFGDVPASLFTPAQLEMTEQFVAKHGGGFLMLGGVESFNLGGYQNTAIAKMLPVTLAREGTPYNPADFNIRIVHKMSQHPIMRQVDDPLQNVTIWNTVSSLMGHNPIGAIKPGAIALLEHQDRNEPILVVQNYGSGRTAAFTTGGSWYWRMNRSIGDPLHERFWRQLIRWLSVGSQPKLSIDLEKDVFSFKEPVRIKATVLGRDLEPVNDATVIARIEDPYGNATEVQLAWILNEDGVYQEQYIPKDRGEYGITINVEYSRPGEAPGTNAVEKMQGKAAFTVSESYAEFLRSWRNEEILFGLAERTGGKYCSQEADIGKLFDEIKKRMEKKAKVEDQHKDLDLWDMPVLFLVLVIILSLEWFYRRRLGLP